MKILFLGYSEKETSLIKFLRDCGNEVTENSERISTFKGYDLVISFGYRHIISKEMLDSVERKVINLHISFLPYNRGAHPNFWSFFEDTPKGVTLHHIDEGIDTGEICFQKVVEFTKDENTYLKTQLRLLKEIEQLFIENYEVIIRGDYETKKQVGKGTFHKKSDLPGHIGWEENIEQSLERLRK
jgi:methionyl-tRNA formyltransferase